MSEERIAHIVSSSGVICLIVGSDSYSIRTEHPNYDAIKEALKAPNSEELRNLADIPRAIKAYTGNGKVEVVGGEIFYDGTVLDNGMTQRILELMEGGFPFEPMLRFLENLMENPSSRAVRELYGFLQNKHLPITEDGHFLVYKGTRADGLDRYSGTVDNKIGAVIEMPRNQVDDDQHRTCSHGFHVGAMEYVRLYCTERVIICKVNPRDAVSVPTDHSSQKLRVCRYEVVCLYDGDLNAGPLYSSDGKLWDEKVEAEDQGYGGGYRGEGGVDDFDEDDDEVDDFDQDTDEWVY